MKKQTINKSTLLLAFLAMAFWYFYFWKKDRDIETIAFHQSIVDEAIRYEVYHQNDIFLREVKSSWYNHIMYFDDDKKPKTENFEAKLYKSIPDYGNYLSSLEKIDNQLLYGNKFYKDGKLDFRTIYLNELKDLFNSDKKEKRKKDSALVNEKLDYLRDQSVLFKKADFHKIDWNESNDLYLWLDIIKHKKEVIELINSTFEENKKKFPTSFESNHFEGYSTLIPDYENQKMIVKAFYFQSDTKYGTDFQKRLPKYLIASYNPFELRDSTFYPMQNPRTYHIFNDIGDTTLHLYFLNKETGKRFAEHSNYGIEFRVIPKK